MRGRIWLGLVIGLGGAAAAAAPPVEAYGALPSVDFVTLSPDGEQVALAVTVGQVRQIQVRKVVGRAALHAVPIGTAKLRALQWDGDHHLLITCSTTTDIEGLTGPKREWSLVLDLNLATGKANPLLGGQVTGVEDKLNTVDGVPEVRTIGGRPVAFAVGTSFPNGRGVRTLFRVDLASQITKQAAIGNDATDGWLIDDGGKIAARVDYYERTGHWQLWTRRGDRLTQSMDGVYPVDTPTLAGFGRTADTVMVETPDGDEWNYHEVALGGDQPSPAIATLAGAVLVTDPKTGIVIGARRDDGLGVTYDFLAGPDQRLWSSVAKAFPGAVVRIESWSDDRHRLVLRVEGKDVGAAYFLLDATTKHADWLANEYAGIEAEDLGQQTAIRYPAGDGVSIPAFLTLPPGRPVKNLPLIVLPHGGPGAHDDAGFYWWAQAVASRGYAVLQPQFRGSTGFGEKFHAAGFGEWGRKMQTDLSDGVAYLAHAGTIDPRRVCIVGGSYGGYAALAGATLQHGVYRCAVSLAGPANLRAMLDYEQTMTGGTRNSTLRFWQRFMGAKSASDPALDAISPLRLADRADVPILLIHGLDDTVVPYAQSKTMAAALQRAGHPATFVTLPGEDHWLSRGETRTAMLRATVDFLDRNLPAGTAAPAASPGPAGGR